MRLPLALLLLAATAAPALAQRGDQMEAYRAMREGRIRPLGDILSRIPAGRRRAFIGSEFAPGDRYRLKFMDRGAVSSVDYDARTGEVMNDRAPRGFDGGRVPAYDDRRGYDAPRGGRFDEERARAYEDRERDGEDRRGDRFEDRRGGRDYDGRRRGRRD